VDLLNDLTPTGAGNHQLPNLRVGEELNLGLQLKLPGRFPTRRSSA
jgi:Ca-activated chloride channel family protein